VWGLLVQPDGCGAGERVRQASQRVAVPVFELRSCAVSRSRLPLERFAPDDAGAHNMLAASILKVFLEATQRSSSVGP
jgi:hypothetical protein